MSYKRKNKDQLILLLAGILLLLLGGIYFFQKKVYAPFSGMKIAVYPTVLEVGDTLHVSEDHIAFQGVKRWEFGDGNFSMENKGTHSYKN